MGVCFSRLQNMWKCCVQAEAVRQCLVRNRQKKNPHNLKVLWCAPHGRLDMKRVNVCVRKVRMVCFIFLQEQSWPSDPRTHPMRPRKAATPGCEPPRTSPKTSLHGGNKSSACIKSLSKPPSQVRRLQFTINYAEDGLLLSKFINFKTMCSWPCVIDRKLIQ